MELHNKICLQKHISWGSIIAGIFTVIAIHCALMLLSGTIISPDSFKDPEGVSSSFLIWMIASTLISLACGAFIAGRLAGCDGAIHGFLVWATSFVISTIITFFLISGIIQTLGNVIGSTASTTGNIVSNVASAGGNGIQKTADLGKEIFGGLDINTDLNTNDIDQKIKSALEKSNIPTLQPEYLKQQLNETKQDLTQTIREISFNPNKTDTIISDFLNNLKKRGQKIAKPINRDQVEQIISSNSDLNTAEAHQAINNYIDMYNNTVNNINTRINELEKRVQQAKDAYIQFKKEAKEQAAQTAKMVSRMALWGFIDLVIGAIISGIFGLWGARTRLDISN